MTRTRRSQWVGAWTTCVVLSGLMMGSGCPSDPLVLPPVDTFSVQFIENGAEIANFHLDGQSIIAVGDGGSAIPFGAWDQIQPGVGYGMQCAVLVGPGQPGSMTTPPYIGLMQVAMQFDGRELVTGPIDAADLTGFVLFQHNGNVGVFNNSDIPDRQILPTTNTPTGAIDLHLTDGRFVGTFDITMGTLRAIGDINVPDSFSQLPAALQSLIDLLQGL